MKILVLSALYTPNTVGGAEITARAVAEGLAASGHDIAVVSLAQSAHQTSCEIGGVRCIYIPLANLFWLHGPKQRPAWHRILWHLIDAYNPIMGKRFGAVLDIEKPDVIHAHNLQGFSVAALREANKRGIPVVQTLHDYYFGCGNSTMYKRGRNCAVPCNVCRILTLPRRWLSSVPDTVTGVSERVLTRLETLGLFNKVRIKHVIYGCNLEEPSVSPRLDKSPAENIVLGFFGRIEPIKGLEILLETLSTMPNEPFTLLIGGRGETAYVDSLKTSYPNPKVRFLGFTRPADFFAQIDILVVPSLWEEPLGRVIHESFSYGVPVIASRMGGMTEIIKPNETGYLFNAGDSGDLSRILKKLSNFGLRAQDFFVACRESSRRFQLDKIVSHYLDALTDAAVQKKMKIS